MKNDGISVAMTINAMLDVVTQREIDQVTRLFFAKIGAPGIWHWRDKLALFQFSFYSLIHFQSMYGGNGGGVYASLFGHREG